MKTFHVGRRGPGTPLIGFSCPGCGRDHAVPYEGDRAWSWNGVRDRPTIQPSLLTVGRRMPTDAEALRILSGERVDLPAVRCHVVVTDGMLAFCSDSTHALAGQTVEMIETEEYGA